MSHDAVCAMYAPPSGDPRVDMIQYASMKNYYHPEVSVWKIATVHDYCVDARNVGKIAKLAIASLPQGVFMDVRGGDRVRMLGCHKSVADERECADVLRKHREHWIIETLTELKKSIGRIEAALGIAP
jgi:hypothetical protein